MQSLQSLQSVRGLSVSPKTTTPAVFSVNDLTANANNLTNNGVTGSTDSPFGDSSFSALFEKANTDYLSIASGSRTNFTFTTTFTVEFWLKLNTTGIFQWIFTNDNNSSNATRGIWLSVTNANKLDITVTDGSGGADEASQAINTSGWHHYAITCNIANASATTFEFFTDGVSQGNGTLGTANNITTINNPANTLYVGRNYEANPSDFPLDGYLDDLRFWNTVRTSVQISGNYNKELVGNESGLIAYYPFEA